VVLTVEGLQTDTNPAGVWYADVGLGDALHDPLPLIEGAYLQSPWHRALDRQAAAPVGDWHLIDALRGLVLRRIGDRPSQSVISTKAELPEAFDGLALHPDDLDAGRMDTLWRKLCRQHEEWEAAGGS